jgi:hypothetical protein
MRMRLALCVDTPGAYRRGCGLNPSECLSMSALVFNVSLFFFFCTLVIYFFSYTYSLTIRVCVYVFESMTFLPSFRVCVCVQVMPR